MLLLHCSDFLQGNRGWYAPRARRRKIRLVKLTAANIGGAAITVDFTGATLQADGQTHPSVEGEAIARELSEFNWDFLFYWILHFSLLELALDLAIFLTGSLFNRSLRKHLAQVLHRKAVLKPGESVEGLLAFRKVARRAAAEVALPWSQDGTQAGCARSELREAG